MNGLTKHQLFALNHYLSKFDDSLSFEELLDAVEHSDFKNALCNDRYNDMQAIEVRDEINQMAHDLKHIFK